MNALRVSAFVANGLVGAAPVGQVADQQLAAERFASTFAWAFWQSPANVLKPTSKHDEAAAIAPAGFRALVASLVARGATPA